MPPLPRTRQYPRHTHAHARQPRQREQQAGARDRRKRYGMVFTTNPLQDMAVQNAGDGEEDDDGTDESTWSMSRARASRHMLSRRRPASVRARNSSPAQQIAARYRASRADEAAGGTSSASASVTYVDGYSSAGTRVRTTSGSTDLSSTSGPRMRYRDSRALAMNRAVRRAESVCAEAPGLTRANIETGGVPHGRPRRRVHQRPLPAAGMPPCPRDDQRPCGPPRPARHRPPPDGQQVPLRPSSSGQRTRSLISMPLLPPSFPASYSSTFVNTGHSVRGYPARARRRYTHSPAPYPKPLPPLPSRGGKSGPLFLR